MERLSFKDLLAIVDKLEAELRDLRREAQRGEQFVKHAEEEINKDMKKGAEIEKRIAVIGKDIREWEDREKWLLDALDSSPQTSQLLEQMEVEARAKLEHEKNTTNDLYHKLNSNLNKMRAKIDSDKEKLLQIPESSSLLNLQASISSKSAQLAKNKERIDQLKLEVASLQEGLTKKNDDNWKEFQGLCVKLAETSLKQRTQELSVVVTRTGDNSSSSRIGAEVDVQEEEEAMDVVETGDGDAPAVNNDVVEDNMEEAAPVTVGSTSSSSDPKSSVDPIIDRDPTPAMSLSPTYEDKVEPPTPRTKALHLKLGTSLLTLKKSKQAADNMPKPPQLLRALSNTRKSPGKVVQGDGSKVEVLESEAAPSFNLSLKLNAKVNSDSMSPSTSSTTTSDKDKDAKISKARSRPSSPIPRLIGSMFSGRSSSSARSPPPSARPASLSRVPSSSEKPKQAEKEKARSRPSSPIPKLISSVFNRPDGSPVRLKSFRLGLPSLFPRKKSNLGQEETEAAADKATEETPPAPAVAPPKPKRQESFHVATLDASKQQFILLGMKSKPVQKEQTAPEHLPKLRDPFSSEKDKEDAPGPSLKMPVKTPTKSATAPTPAPVTSPSKTPFKLTVNTPVKKPTPAKTQTPLKTQSPAPTMLQSPRASQTPFKAISQSQVNSPEAKNGGASQTFLDVSVASSKPGNDSFVRNLFEGEMTDDGEETMITDDESDKEDLFPAGGNDKAEATGGDFFGDAIWKDKDDKDMKRAGSSGGDFFGSSMWGNSSKDDDDDKSFFDLGSEKESGAEGFSFSFGTQNDDKDSQGGGYGLF